MGDLADPAFLPTLRKYQFKSVVCANLLEHVVDRSGVCQGMLGILPPGGYVFITCPKSFPFHPDPIDTLFRPGIEDLAALFPGADVCAAEIIACGSWWGTLKGPQDLFLRVCRMFVRFWRRRAFYRDSAKVAHLFKGFRVTCLVLRKESEPFGVR